MTAISRTRIVGGVVALAVILLAVYGVCAFMKESKNHDLVTSVDSGLDEATLTIFTKRITETKAAIAAQEQAGAEVDLDLYLSLANDAYTIGDLVTAKEALEAELKANPINYTAQNSYGTVLEAMHDYDGALVAYKAAVASGAKVEEYYRDELELLKTQFPDRRDEMKAVIELSIAERGQTSWSMVELGKWYKEAGDCAQAIEHYEVAVSLAPENKTIASDLSELRKTCK